MYGKELPPGRLFHVFGRWLKTVLLEDIGDCAPGHMMTLIGQGPTNAPVAPVPILSCHLHDQVPDLGHNARASGATPTPAFVFLRDESSMPGEQCVECDPCLDLSEGLASERHGLRGQATALRVREAEPLRREVFPKDAVLFLEVVDDVALLLVDPAGHGDDEELQQVRKLAHTGRG